MALSRLVQFHPSYGYEDFMHGIRPVVQRRTNDVRAHTGPFLQFCKSSTNVYKDARLAC